MVIVLCEPFVAWIAEFEVMNHFLQRAGYNRTNCECSKCFFWRDFALFMSLSLSLQSGLAPASAKKPRVGAVPLVVRSELFQLDSMARAPLREVFPVEQAAFPLHSGLHAVPDECVSLQV